MPLLAPGSSGPAPLCCGPAPGLGPKPKPGSDEWVRQLDRKPLLSVPKDWELELEFKDSGPKNEHTQCNNDYDKGCQDRLKQLQRLYGLIRTADVLGIDVSNSKMQYNQAASRYHRDCPYWKPVLMFPGAYYQ
jgi:hypothetical protein